jgi:hypothetical protein
MTKPKKGILVIGILLITAILIIITYNPKSPGKKHSGTFSNQHIPEITMKTFQVNEHWGYQIYIDTTLYIYQEFIPGLPGEQYFTTETEALGCAKLVREKLLKSKIPSISTEELDRLGVKYHKD